MRICVYTYCIPPPRHYIGGSDGTILRVLQAEEDDDDRDREARVEARGQDVCVRVSW